MKFTNALKNIFIDTAKQFKGSVRRIFMARVVRDVLGEGGQREAEREFGWNRGTIRKGMQELESGIPIPDNFEARGRKATEDRLPYLLDDITEIAQANSQIDPSFKSERLYTRLSATEVRQQLIRDSRI